MRQLPPDLSSKINQSLQTIDNNAQPNMAISVSRAKNTVQDSSYWTVETIREISGLGDVSVAPRRFNVSGRPDRIYEIHVRNGEVFTSIREYPDKLREGFKTQFGLGPGKSVGIAFNGEWKRYRRFYRLITDEKPWIAWVDNNNILWVQKWDEINTKKQLSTDTGKVKMIRAWKNLVIRHQDQGIIVAYIKKDGKVYYRNYCIQEDGSEAWEYEKELTSFKGVAVNVNLFITNDYRMGFIIEDNTGKIHWLVTHRNWGGMASPAENINTGIKEIKMEVIPIKYYKAYSDHENLSTGINDIWLNVAEPIYPKPIYAENPDESPEKILLRFSHNIDVDMNIVKNAFTIRDSRGIIFPITMTLHGMNNSEIIFIMGRFDSAFGNMTISYNRNVYGIDSIHQGSRFGVDSFDFIFTPILTPPARYSTENLQVGIKDISVQSTQVYYKNFSGGEKVNTGISDISIVVTKVGSNPL